GSRSPTDLLRLPQGRYNPSSFAACVPAPPWKPLRPPRRFQKGGRMPEKRVTVWVQRFKDRRHLMLQWTDPDTGRRKSRSAETDDPGAAETARADLEYE